MALKEEQRDPNQAWEPFFLFGNHALPNFCPNHRHSSSHDQRESVSHDSSFAVEVQGGKHTFSSLTRKRSGIWVHFTQKPKDYAESSIRKVF